MAFLDDPVLSKVLAAELANGNETGRKWTDECGRDHVDLARAFSRDWRSSLAEPGVYASRRAVSVAIDHGEYSTFHEEILETDAAVIHAPEPTAAERDSRSVRAEGNATASAVAQGPIPQRLLLLRLARAIENDLREIGVWREGVTEVPPFRAAFGADVMPFSDWLQLVFLPRLREIAERDLPLPGPGVAAYAVRELDGDDRYSKLCSRLSWLDSLSPSRGVPVASVAAFEGRRLTISFGLLVLLLAVSAVAIGIGFAICEEIEAKGGFVERGVSVSLQATGLACDDDAELELRIDARGKKDQELRFERLELVNLRSQPFRGFVPGLRPLEVTIDSPPDRTVIVAWFVARGVGPARCDDDARVVLEFANSLRGVAGDSEGFSLPAPWREIGERSRFPYQLGMGEGIRIAIVLATLVIFLVPAAWWGVRQARRIAARG